MFHHHLYHSHRDHHHHHQTDDQDHHRQEVRARNRREARGSPRALRANRRKDLPNLLLVRHPLFCTCHMQTSGGFLLGRF